MADKKGTQTTSVLQAGIEQSLNIKETTKAKGEEQDTEQIHHFLGLSWGKRVIKTTIEHEEKVPLHWEKGQDK